MFKGMGQITHREQKKYTINPHISFISLLLGEIKDKTAEMIKVNNPAISKAINILIKAIIILFPSCFIKYTKSPTECQGANA
jgi:hypothetical protein